MDTLGIGASGLSAHALWMGTTANNIANVSAARPADVTPPRPQTVVMASAPAGAGVRATVVDSGNPEGISVYQPDSPLAGPEGTVTYPDIDLGQQMGSLILSQRGYELNLATLDRARQAYEAVLRMGEPGR